MDDHQLNRFFSDSIISTLSMHPFESDLLSESKKLYADMKENHRNEYFYKNELFNQIFIPLIKNQKNATLYKEWYVNHSWFDIAIFEEGKSPAIFEIKSDLDSVKRLPKQISNYYGITPNVNVLCSIKLANEVLNTVPEETGVYILDTDAKIRKVRNAKDRWIEYQPYQAFELLRSDEKTALVPDLYSGIMNDRQSVKSYYQIEYFQKLSIARQQTYISSCFINRIRNQKNIFYLEPDLLSEIPYELRLLFYVSKNNNKCLALNNIRKYQNRMN